MYKQERFDKILAILYRKKNVSIEDLCKESFCSAATIRRDLITLEEMGLIIRGRGGASISSGTRTEYSHKFRESTMISEKLYMCSIAENFLSNGLALFLDSSSTVYPICTMLEKYKNITVVTNGLATATKLSTLENIDTYITGGYISSSSTAIVGEFSTNFIQNFKADVAIISCRGVDADGIYEANQNSALVKQQMIHNSRTTILLCDSSKIGNFYFYKLCGFNDIEAVITDKKPPNEIYDAITHKDCEILF